MPGQLAIAPQWWLAGLGRRLRALAAASHALLKVLRLPVLVSAMAHCGSRRTTTLADLAGRTGVHCVRRRRHLVLVRHRPRPKVLLFLAGILLGAALLLPVMLGLILRIGEQAARRPLVAWAWADSRQQLPGLSLALMALLLAFAVNVGVGTMVGSFSQTFSRWLDGRLAAEIFVVAKDNAQGAEIEAWLRQRSDVIAILPSVRAETQVGGEPIELLGVADHATYRDSWPLLQSSTNAWDHVRDGDAVLVSEQLGRRLDLHIGSELRIPVTSGVWVATVAGLYADYGNQGRSQ